MPTVHKAFKYKLAPTPEQERQLFWTLARCRELYNAGLQERRDAWKMRRVNIGYYEQKAELPGIKEVRPEYKDIHSQALQDVILRLDRAFKKFFGGSKNGDKGGYPRFKGQRRRPLCPLGPHWQGSGHRHGTEKLPNNERRGACRESPLVPCLREETALAQ